MSYWSAGVRISELEGEATVMFECVRGSTEMSDIKVEGMALKLCVYWEELEDLLKH